MRGSFFAELQRRNVYKVGAMYAVSGWLLVQVVTQVFPIFDVSALAQRIIVLAIVAGFPVALVLSWVYELTPQGIVKTDEVAPSASVTRATGQKLNHAIIAVLGVAVLVLLAKVLWPHAASAPAEAANDKSIAVLPFVNMSGEAGNDYFSDGITEEILNAAAQIPGLRVAARTSAFQFKGKNVDLRQVGEILSVAYVLEGSVQRAGDEVRITAQLIDAHSGYHRWSQKFDRKLTSVFAIEDEIANAIVDQLKLQMDQHGPLVREGTGNPQAHELYLKALAKIAARGRADLLDAVDFLKQAVSLDPQYAAAWAALAGTSELLPWYEMGEWNVSLDQAQAAAAKALALDDGVAEAHAVLATVLRDRGDYAAAGKAYDQALALNPQSAEILDQHAQYLFLIGQFEAGIAGERRALALDPLSLDPHLQLGIVLQMLHRYDEALEELGAVLAINPALSLPNFDVALLKLRMGDVAAAEQYARKGANSLHADPEAAAAFMRAAADPTQRLAALARVKTFISPDDDAAMPPHALWYALLGDPAGAVAATEQWAASASRRQVIFGSFFFGNPVFDLVRADPRFRAALEKAGLPAAAIEAAAEAPK